MSGFGELVFRAQSGTFWEIDDRTERRPIETGQKSAVSRIARRRRGHPVVRKAWAVILRLYCLNPRPARLPLPYV